MTMKTVESSKIQSNAKFLLFCSLAVGHRVKKEKQNDIENKPTHVAKPITQNKITTIAESEIESEVLNDKIESVEKSLVE